MFFTADLTDWPIRISIALLFLALSVVCNNAQTKPLNSPSPPEQEQKTIGASIIRGRVIYADTGRPLRRADVSLISQDSGTWTQPSITDRRGEFVFTDVSAGSYFVVVSARDIVSPLDQVGRTGSLALKIALGQVEDGFAEVTVDGRTSAKVEIRASRGGAITGRVLSDYDEPIPKAEIKLLKVMDGKLQPVSATWDVLDREKQMFETDSRGVYRIAGLAAGEYIVRASESNEGGNPDDAAEGSYTDGSMLVVYYPKALRVHDATNVKVQLGAETRDIDIRIADRGVHRVSGTVVVDGRAVRYAEIRLNRGEPEGRNRFDSVRVRTDNEGHWEIRGVPEGTYKLSVSGQVGGMVRFDDENGYVTVATQQQEVTVAGADVTNLKTVLREGGTVKGVVSFDSKPLPEDRLMIELVQVDLNSNNARTKSGAGPGGQLSPAAPDDKGVSEQSFVRENGAFSISGLPSGVFQFRVNGLGTYQHVKAITREGKNLLRDPLRVGEGQTIDAVRIVLSAEVVTFSGRAVARSDRSKPLADVAILLLPVEAERRRIVEEPLIVRADREGRFVVRGAPGEYFVFVLDRRQKGIPLVAPTEETLIKDSAKLQKVRLQAGEEKRLVEVLGQN